jgi:hypothetical protein
MRFLDETRLAEVEERAFQQRRPYPWINPEGLLRDEAFELLSKAAPNVAHFEASFGQQRAHGQKNHDRYNLEYERADPHVPQIWHEFAAELRAEPYERFIRRLFGTRSFRLRFHWHYAPRSCQVSPHCDSKSKLGSHIFYLNREEEWDSSWGGETLVLDDGGRFSRRSAPEFSDFDDVIHAQTLGNRSFVFQRGEHSWHGVEEIRCPEGQMRKVFIVSIDLHTPKVRVKEFFRGRRAGY